MAREDHERVLRAVIWEGWPDLEPEWAAFLEGGAVLRGTDAEANVWVPLGPAHCLQPRALPPEEPAAAAALAPTQAETHVTAKPDHNGPTPGEPGLGPQTVSTGGWERTDGLGRHPRHAWAPQP